MEYKIFLGYLAIVIEVISYLIYFHGIWKGKTKPHAFTWLAWGVANIVAFFAVWVSGGDIIAWVLGLNALFCLLIAMVGFWQRNVDYDKYDWLALLGALVGIFLWWLMSDPFYAVLLVSLSDGISFVPTFRKAYRLPFEENAPSFLLGIFYYVFAILALSSFTFTAVLYPAVIIFMDGALVALIYFRRKTFGKNQSTL